MRLLPYGDIGWLLDCESLEEARRWHAGLRPALAGRVADLVLGARTVLVAAGDTPLQEIRRVIEATEPADPGAGHARHVTLPVRYDGPDLEEVAAITGLTPDAVVAAHTGSVWTVAFGGFAPGFAYLVTDHERLHVPRRARPRPRVTAGSVGLAGAFSGVYPRPSPGGWQVIGHTEQRLWDVQGDPPALLQPGTVVRFEAVP